MKKYLIIIFIGAVALLGTSFAFAETEDSTNPLLQKEDTVGTTTPTKDKADVETDDDADIETEDDADAAREQAEEEMEKVREEARQSLENFKAKLRNEKNKVKAEMALE